MFSCSVCFFSFSLFRSWILLLWFFLSSVNVRDVVDSLKRIFMLWDVVDFTLQSSHYSVVGVKTVVLT